MDQSCDCTCGCLYFLSSYCTGYNYLVKDVFNIPYCMKGVDIISHIFRIDFSFSSEEFNGARRS